MSNLERKCPCEGGTLTRFIQPVILSIFADESMTAYSMIQEMENYEIFAKERPDQAGVYRYIKRMTSRGYLRKCASPNGEQDFYEVTAKGLDCLSKWKKTLIEYQKDITSLIKEIK